ncbi:Hydroxyacid oxidase 2 [Holothuria leucospilota]|uniref:Hydroxyacid oxidase 2 n=1 Tax=Holothuria leucospilota TaxID=206669 RepID=A0A9Q1CBV2_HOLLE|nr:Hydroxyacid oxidase 2 [Holothuria leucospilota]
MTSQFRAVSLGDYELEARKYLSADGLLFYGSGSDGEETLRDNTKVSRKYRLRPRVLINVSTVDTSSKILGHPINFPICISPSAFHRFAHIEGEMASAKGKSFIEMKRITDELKTYRPWHLPLGLLLAFHHIKAYVMKSKELQMAMLRDLKKNGFKGVVLSVDCPVVSTRRKQFGPSMMEKG